MKNILAHPAAVARFARSNVLLGFDYDGTLAPIVAAPAAADMGERTGALLAEVARRYPCVVISGRARADVRGRLYRARVRATIGNHGVERRATDAVAAEIRRWRPLLEERLAAFRGVVVEDKRLSLAVHYRNGAAKARARAAILAAAAALGDARVFGGKQVVNLVPRWAPHKGAALERERERLGCDTAVYIGDDVTDEDVFALEHPDRLLAIRVGASVRSRAPYYLPRQADIDELLRRLIALRGAG